MLEAARAAVQSSLDIDLKLESEGLRLEGRAFHDGRSLVAERLIEWSNIELSSSNLLLPAIADLAKEIALLREQADD